MPTLLFTTTCAVTLSVWAYGAYFAWVWFSQRDQPRKPTTVTNPGRRHSKISEDRSNVPIETSDSCKPSTNGIPNSSAGNHEIVLPRQNSTQSNATTHVQASPNGNPLGQDQSHNDSAQKTFDFDGSLGRSSISNPFSHVNVSDHVSSPSKSRPVAAGFDVAPRMGAEESLSGTAQGRTGASQKSGAAFGTTNFSSATPVKGTTKSPTSVPFARPITLVSLS